VAACHRPRLRAGAGRLSRGNQSWHWIFIINVPVSLAALAFAALVLRESKERFGVAGIALIVALVFVELRTAEPMLNMRLFKDRLFSSANAVQLVH
jgi:MFS family permease